MSEQSDASTSARMHYNQSSSVAVTDASRLEATDKTKDSNISRIFIRLSGDNVALSNYYIIQSIINSLFHRTRN